MADLFSLVPTTDTIDVELKHPVTDEVLLKDDKTPMTITVYAPHSAEYKAAIYEQANKRIKKAAKSKNTTFDAKEMDDSTLDLISKTTKDWNIQLEKKSPKFSQEAAKELYVKLPWLKQQVQEAQEDYNSFLKG